jgi:5-methyltetrahydrofolate--homocysteine methyltransferase
MGLTDSLAMTPAASVSGFYIAHPEAQYFSVGKVGDDQVQDLAQRSGVELKALQRLLAPNL